MTMVIPHLSPLVVVVDDDISVRRSTRRLLRSAGLEVETFASAEDLLRLGRLEEMACLILDLRMPRMSGLELQSWLVANLGSIPIIFLSACSTAEDEHQARQAGAVHFLHKPVGKEVLLSAIRDAMRPGPCGR